jgi:hypothetical protein
MAVGLAELNEFWALIDEVGIYAQEDLVAIFSRMRGMSREESWAYLSASAPEVASMWRSSVVDLATLFYAETQAIDVDREIATFARALNSEQFEESLRWAFFSEKNSSPLSAASGLLDRTVTDGAREYGVASMGKTKTTFMRAAQPNACAFCRMLARNEYSTVESAFYVGYATKKKSTKRKRGEQFHDHCRCQVVKASEYEPPDYLSKWADEYDEAVKGTRGDTAAILANMRNLSGSH